MPKKRAGLSSQVYDRKFPDVDDVDHMAYLVRERAIEERERSVAGLLRSLAHIACYEDSALDDIVIDPELVDELAESHDARDRKIIEQASVELRRWLDGEDSGKRQRALYALVRFFGPTSDLVASGLAGPPAAQIAVVHALADPLYEDAEADDPEPDDLETDVEKEHVKTDKRKLRFPVMPASLLPLLRPLFSPKAVKRRAGGDVPHVADSARVLRLLLRIEPGAAADEVNALLVEALENEEYRPLLQDELAEGTLSRIRMTPSPAIRERFERGAAIIEGARKAGLPSRVEIAALGPIAAFVRRDEAMARRTASIFDLLCLVGSTTSPRMLAPFVDLLVASMDLLRPDEHDKLAAFMTREPEEGLPAAAAAWVRLDPAKAKELARRFNGGTRDRVEGRWLAAARAHMAWPGRKPEIAALIPETALGAALGDAPSEIARPLLESLLRKARNSAELLSAVSIASARGERAVLGAVLEKLRDTPFRVDAKLERLLIPLMGPENEDMVRIEIDGENPFRDRRDALSRALSAALPRARER